MFYKNVVEKSKHISYYSIILFPENRAVYEMMWENVVDPNRLQVKK